MGLKFIANDAARDCAEIRITDMAGIKLDNSNQKAILKGGHRHLFHRSTTDASRSYRFINKGSSLAADSLVVTRADRLSSMSFEVAAPSTYESWLITDVNDLSASGWAKDNVSITADAIAAPDGTTTADEITASASTARHQVYQTSAPVTAGAQYRILAAVKKNNHDLLWIGDGGDAQWHGAVFRFSDESISAGAYTDSARATDLGNSWYLIEVVYTRINASGSNSTHVALQNTFNANAPESWAASGTESTYVGFVYLEDYSVVYTSASGRTLVGLNSQDFVYTGLSLASTASLSLDIIGDGEKLINSLCFGTAVDLTGWAVNRPIQIRPHDRDADILHGKHHYKIHEVAELEFACVDDSTLKSFEKLAFLKEMPVFMYDENEEFLPGKLWHCVVKYQTEKVANDNNSLFVTAHRLFEYPTTGDLT